MYYDLLMYVTLTLLPHTHSYASLQQQFDEVSNQAHHYRRTVELKSRTDNETEAKLRIALDEVKLLNFEVRRITDENAELMIERNRFVYGEYDGDDDCMKLDICA